MKGNLLDKYKFISQILITFSVTIIFIFFIGVFFGEDVKSHSSMFRLGGQGIASDTIFQVFLSSTVVSVINYIFSSGKIFKKMATVWKMTLMVICIFIAVIIFIICFEWFPIYLAEAWIGFFVSFGVFFLASTIIMVTKTKIEAKKYDELLKNYKKRHKEEIEYIREVERNDE